MFWRFYSTFRKLSWEVLLSLYPLIKNYFFHCILERSYVELSWLVALTNLWFVGRWWSQSVEMKLCHCKQIGVKTWRRQTCELIVISCNVFISLIAKEWDYNLYFLMYLLRFEYIRLYTKIIYQIWKNKTFWNNVSLSQYYFFVTDLASN